MWLVTDASGDVHDLLDEAPMLANWLQWCQLRLTSTKNWHSSKATRPESSSGERGLLAADLPSCDVTGHISAPAQSSSLPRSRGLRVS